MKKLCLWILVILWATLIFGFSSQTKGPSGELSRGISKKVVSAVTDMNENSRTSEDRNERIRFSRALSITEAIVRKCAHFILFLVLGVLVLMLVESYKESKQLAIVFAALICLAYGVSDELHQLFVAGRDGNFTDVMIDFCGSVSGIVILKLIRKIKRNIIKR